MAGELLFLMPRCAAVYFGRTASPAILAFVAICGTIPADEYPWNRDEL